VLEKGVRVKLSAKVVIKPILAKPWVSPNGTHYEYRRNGNINLFVLIDVHRPWPQGQKSMSGERQKITPNACATSSDCRRRDN